jgi:hypothetical protein
VAKQFFIAFLLMTCFYAACCAMVGFIAGIETTGTLILLPLKAVTKIANYAAWGYACTIHTGVAL